MSNLIQGDSSRIAAWLKAVEQSCQKGHVPVRYVTGFGIVAMQQPSMLNFADQFTANWQAVMPTTVLHTSWHRKGSRLPAYIHAAGDPSPSPQKKPVKLV